MTNSKDRPRAERRAQQPKRSDADLTADLHMHIATHDQAWAAFRRAQRGGGLERASDGLDAVRVSVWAVGRVLARQITRAKG